MMELTIFWINLELIFFIKSFLYLLKIIENKKDSS